ncbi:MAG: anti-sigma-D factor RsdA [Mycobacterium sp.]|nr:anti-sigma-D factor RsdA [Mycobacterium sp.]
MREFRYAPDQAALDELARTDLLLDALAERRPVEFHEPEDPDDPGPGDEALAVLLEDWRDNLRWPPASGLVSPEEAVEALRTGMADRRRNRRALAAIGSVAVTLLMLSGFGAVVAEARPGDALYGLHAMFFDRPRVNDNQIMLSAKADLAKVQQMIDQGRWDRAHDQLVEVSSTLQSMNDGASRNDLMNQFNLLNTKVQSRDPNATPPENRPSPTAVASPTPNPGSYRQPEPTPIPRLRQSGDTP